MMLGKPVESLEDMMLRELNAVLLERCVDVLGLTCYIEGAKNHGLSVDYVVCAIFIKGVVMFLCRVWRHSCIWAFLWRRVTVFWWSFAFWRCGLGWWLWGFVSLCALQSALFSWFSWSNRLWHLGVVLITCVPLGWGRAA